jgi:agmatine/peptidylarginine deiminase
MIRKYMLVSSIVVAVQVVLSAPALNPLPNWIDEKREKIVRTSMPEMLVAAPPTNFRVPAEYEPASGVVLGWSGFPNLLTGIAQASAAANATVYAVGGPSRLTGLDSTRYKPIQLALDTVWMRDYGPLGIDSTGKVGFVDTVYRHFQYRVDDDQLPTRLAGLFSYDAFSMPLILDGGNFMVDSVGNLFMTKRTYLWNRDLSEAAVDSLLKEYFNAKNIYAIDYAGYPGQPADGTGHIDMFVKLLNDNTVLIATADTEPFKSTGEKAIRFFQSLTAPNGSPYQILLTKGWVRNRAWYTYTNSLIVNNVVIVPSYQGRQADEQVVKRLYEQGMPGVNVRFVLSDESIVQGGSIHCVTQSIPRA